jgi:adenylate kinase family enzyme
MRIVLIGAPGSGKTHIAQVLSRATGALHIECDEFFWNGQDVREEVSKLVPKKSWILDGHLSKVSDLVLPRAQKFIVVEGLELRSLYRSLKRDYSNPRKLWFNLQHHHRMKLKRQELMEEILSRGGELLVLDNYPDLSDEEIVSVINF